MLSPLQKLYVIVATTVEQVLMHRTECVGGEWNLGKAVHLILEEWNFP